MFDYRILVKPVIKILPLCDEKSWNLFINVLDILVLLGRRRDFVKR